MKESDLHGRWTRSSAECRSEFRIYEGGRFEYELEVIDGTRIKHEYAGRYEIQGNELLSRPELHMLTQFDEDGSVMFVKQTPLADGQGETKSLVTLFGSDGMLLTDSAYRDEGEWRPTPSGLFYERYS